MSQTSIVSKKFLAVKSDLLCSISHNFSLSLSLSLSPSLPPSLSPPPLAWIFGDPHLVTLDGYKYTFNGKGEFTLIQAQNGLFKMQGRMQQFNGVAATVLTAVAAKEQYSDTVMIANTRRGIDAYINGERVDLSMIKQQDFNNVSVIRDNNSTISVEFSSGARISAREENGFLSTMAVVLPQSFSTEGLLGVYNGDANDDLLPKGGFTPLATSNTQLRIYELFGLTCKWLLCVVCVCVIQSCKHHFDCPLSGT